MERSTAETWVKVYAVLAYIGAVFAVLLGLLLIVAGPFIIPLVRSAMSAEQQPLAALAGGVLIVLGILCLAFAVLDFFIGRGLWRRQNWARILMIICSALGLLRIFSIGRAPIMALISIIIAGWGLYLFGFNEDVKEIFGAPAAAPAAAVTTPAAAPVVAAPAKPAKKPAPKRAVKKK